MPEFIVFLAPFNCGHCTNFKRVWGRLRPANRAKFDLRTDDTPETNPMRYKITGYPVAFSADPRSASGMNEIEHPLEIANRLLREQNGGFRADTVGRASADASSSLKSIAIVAIVAWVLMF